MKKIIRLPDLQARLTELLAAWHYQCQALFDNIVKYVAYIADNMLILIGSTVI